MRGAQLSLRGLEVSWDRWLRGGFDLRSLALLRIGFASIVLANFLLVRPNVEAWWGEQGWFPMATSLKVVDPDVWSVLTLLPRTSLVLWTCYWIAIVNATLLLLGWCARLNALAVFIWLVSFQYRNYAVTDGEDTVMRLFAFLLVFTASAERFSLDALLRKHRKSLALRWWPAPRWGARFLRVLPALIVFCAGAEKAGGDVWWRGDALYYVSKLDDLFYAGFVPRVVLDSPAALRAATWLALAVELAAPLLVWFRETRRPALICVVLLHLGMLGTMNLFLFQPLMLLLWTSHARLAELVWLRDTLLVRPLRLLVRFFFGARTPAGALTPNGLA